MREFIYRENIKHFRSLLETTTDQAKRKRIMELLAKEEAKLAALGHPSFPTAIADPPAPTNGGVSHLSLEYYRNRLATETSPAIRGILTRLIDEEEARLAPLQARKIYAERR